MLLEFQFNAEIAFVRDNLTLLWKMYERIALGAYNTRNAFNLIIDYNEMTKRADFLYLMNTVPYVNRTPEITGYVQGFSWCQKNTLLYFLMCKKETGIKVTKVLSKLCSDLRVLTSKPSFLPPAQFLSPRSVLSPTSHFQDSLTKIVSKCKWRDVSSLCT